ncbi:hypothetical protein E2562_004294 [Oryza meyeriana var. granulata]|uniref:Uncharacterized protein n=1 Tax=Oryza meyeriana var. granulata TaxID=110450 RepID=A0A6G1BS27_9ORYZ|nr:hypothetical protein E2562_004294 [Oryza meyeriana var. granulata]
MRGAKCHPMPCHSESTQAAAWEGAKASSVGTGSSAGKEQRRCREEAVPNGGGAGKEQRLAVQCPPPPPPS